MEGNEPKPAGGDAATPRRDAEATSSETLSDIEESERVKGTGTTTGSDLEGSSPRPTTEGGGRADGSDTGGPM
jgi:hypothetical protein